MIANMATYESHKIVNAAKILAITSNANGGYRIDYLDRDNKQASVDVSWGWYDQHQASPGWYLVQYKDGYLSASPPGPFEEASIRIDE